MLDLQAAYSNS